jgi:hypothetical protein
LLALIVVGDIRKSSLRHHLFVNFFLQTGQRYPSINALRGTRNSSEPLTPLPCLEMVRQVYNQLVTSDETGFR